MLAAFHGPEWLFWWQLPLVIIFLAVWLVGRTALLWVGAKYLAKLPSATVGQCALAIFVTAVTTGLLIWIPVLGWLAALFLGWLILKLILNTTYLKAILAWVPTIATWVIAIPLLVTILLPSLGMARELTKRTICLTNLNAIGKGCLFYQAAYSAPPPSLKVLVAEGNDPRLFSCPSVPEGCASYLYLAPLPGHAPDCVIACDFAYNHKVMRNVLRADGVAMPMAGRLFAQEMARPANARFAQALAAAEGSLAPRR